MPAHVTALYPFRPLQSLDEAVMLGLKQLIAGLPALDVSFGAIGRFPGVRWLAPEPREPIDRLTQALVAAFPDCLPYRGEFSDPVPHLTFAVGDEALLSQVENEVAAGLSAPIQARIEDCCLFQFTEGRWREAARFAFGRAPERAPAQNSIG